MRNSIPRFLDKTYLPLFILAIILVACASATGEELAKQGATAEDTATELPPTAAPSTTTTLTATATAPPSPTATPSPTTMPTATFTPTSTPTPMNPLSVAYMREAEHPGSDIVIEQQLEPGVNYSRYLASYLSEGNKIYALLTVPMGEKPSSGWPVIIFNHGYIAPEVYRTTERYIAYVDNLARSGYIVFKSDYRGHGSSEGEAGGGYGSPAYTIDVLNAVASIKRFPDADSHRIGMWGHSMGGHVTLRTMVTTDDVKAGVIWAGVVASYPDLMTRWHRGTADNPEPTRPPEHPWRRWRDDLIADYGTPEENPDFWASISPSTFVADLSGPVQLHHGTADEEVPLEFSETLYEEIQAVGGTVEFYTYEGDNHNLSNYFVTAMQRTIEFFDTYVKAAN